MFYVRGVFRIFSLRGIKFRHFVKRSFFPAELILNNLSNKNDSRGSGGMLPQKCFENLHTVMAILVLFQQISGNFVYMFGP